MRTTFRKSFLRDLKKVKDQTILAAVRKIIEQVEAAANLREIKRLQKLTGASDFYRIRLGDYRIGVMVEGDVVEFVRCLPRKDIYRYLP